LNQQSYYDLGAFMPIKENSPAYILKSEMKKA
jgi:hypothetical protein